MSYDIHDQMIKIPEDDMLSNLQCVICMRDFSDSEK